MPGDNWIVESMEEGEGNGNGENEEVEEQRMCTTMAEVKCGTRLRAFMERVKQRMMVGEIILMKLQEGENYTYDDELAIDQLEKALDTFVQELRLKAQDKQFNSSDEGTEYTNIQMAAEDLLVEIKKGCKPKPPDNCGGLAPRFNANVTSCLPKIEMVHFDGNKLKWFEFWAHFRSQVEGRRDLSDVDKMNYLMQALKGEAKEAVEGLDLTDSNYQIALDTLTDLFGKPAIIVDAHYEALLDIAPAQDTTVSCRKVLNEIERHMKVLLTLGENVNNNNCLRHVILKKFPSRIKYDMNMVMRTKEYSVSNIRESLKEVITAMEATQTNNEKKSLADQNTSFATESLVSTNTNNPWKGQFNRGSRRPRGGRGNRGGRGGRGTQNWNDGQKSYSSTTDSKAGTPSNQPCTRNNSKRGRGGKTFDRGNPAKQKRFECPFCSENHAAEDCNKYLTAYERKSKLAGRCFICFGDSHQVADCPSSEWECKHCYKRGHHHSICFSKYLKKTEETTTSVFSQTHVDTILQTALVDVSDECIGKTASARVIFDTGSQKSYITSTLANKLNLQPMEENSLTIYSFGQSEPKTVDTQLVRIQVHTKDNQGLTVMAYVVPTITGPIPSFSAVKAALRKKYPKREIAHDVDQDCITDLLIGNDYYHSFFSGRRDQVMANLYLVQSKVGWILSGCQRSVDNEILSVLTYVQGGGCNDNEHLFTVPDPPLKDDNIKDLWELESLGINDSPKILEQDEIIKFFNETTKFENGRYMVKWPWVQYPKDLPVNYGMARGRLISLIGRIDEPTLIRYDAVLKDQEAKGVIEVIQETKLPSTHAVHYLPHHCVVQEHKTTKLRIVYDASSKSKGHCSLNEYLYKGPLMLESLVSLLLGFRNQFIGITADVEKAFLQVGLQQEDRDVTRFLWVKDINKEVTDNNLVHMRFCRVPFGIISSPYLLAATIQLHLTKKHSEEADRIAKCLYVDNLVTGTQSVEEGLKLVGTAVTAFDELSMNIREWNTNCLALKDLIPQDKRSKDSSATNVLGLTWDLEKDTLKLAVKPTIFSRKVSSKREIMRIVASVFDPCGFVAPLLLPARVYLQRLWADKYRRDTPLTETDLKEWYQLAHPLHHIIEVEVPRYYLDGRIKSKSLGGSDMELHCFTDASQEAYSAVVYMRQKGSNPKASFVISRTKLTPLRSREHITIPKLELLGVLIGTRLLMYVKQALRMTNSRCLLWTDSQVVLSWMKSEKLLEPFVSRRIGEIKSFPSITHRYVSSKDNPADLATRGQASPLPQLWLNGPEFLGLPEKSWPSTSNFMRAGELSLVNTQAQLESDDEQLTYEDPAAEVIPIRQADVIRNIQQQHFPKEVDGHPTHLSRSLDLYADENGILRCKGRLQNALLPHDQKFPILLPRDDPFSLEIIKETHESNYHVGVSQTLALLRKRFWIPKGRSQVMHVIRKCAKCVKYGGGPYKLPPMPPLPPERVQLCHPFIYTGLDYLGPLTVLEKGINQKRWCCIFTCMASRAIRLEVIQNLSADEFLLCLRRFVAAQGIPALIVSDNAAQFRLAAEILQSPICKDNNIAWHFIPELAPWQGGFYERLVGMVKHCLRRTLDKSIVSDSQLFTIFKEIETVLNSRPLTTVGENLEHVLTPSDFLSSCGTHPLSAQSGTDMPGITATKADLIAGWEKGKCILEEFKKMFSDQYLPSLRERAQTPHRQPRVLTKTEPAVGDIVQLWDDRSKSSNRAHWKVGKIVSLVKGTDGKVRTAKVEVESGQTFTRSIAHLYPLEFSEVEDEQAPSTMPPSGSQADSGNTESHSIHRTSSSDDQTAEEHDDHASTPDVHSSPPANNHAATTSSTPPRHSESAQDIEVLGSTRPRRSSAQAARELIRRWTQALATLSHVDNTRPTNAP